MLSVVLSATTIAMNRGEQENLFRQSHNIRLQQEYKNEQEQRKRHYSYGNIHQISNLQAQSIISRSYGEDRPFGSIPNDDLVLSVLKSPLKEHPQPATSPCSGGGGSSNVTCAYTALQGSEDELVEDVESAKETMEFDGSISKTSPRAFQFLRRLRAGRTFEPHHKRVPTPIRRKSRGRSKSRADILDGVTTNRGMKHFVLLFFLRFFITTNKLLFY